MAPIVSVPASIQGASVAPPTSLGRFTSRALSPIAITHDRNHIGGHQVPDVPVD
jgi:hypothetical protein